MHELSEARHETQRAVSVARAAWADAPAHVKAMVKFLFEPMLVALEKTNEELEAIHAEDLDGFDFVLSNGASTADSDDKKRG